MYGTYENILELSITSLNVESHKEFEYELLVWFKIIFFIQIFFSKKLCKISPILFCAWYGHEWVLIENYYFLG